MMVTMNITQRCPALVVLLAGFLVHFATTAAAEPWPGWRGPRGDGTCLERDVPTNWDVSHALWKTELPGRGHASAIVWGERVCTATAFDTTQARVLLCLYRASGKILWQKTVVQGPLGKSNK